MRTLCILAFCLVANIQLSVAVPIFLPESKSDDFDKDRTNVEICRCCAETNSPACCALCDLAEISALRVAAGDKENLESAHNHVLDKLYEKYNSLLQYPSADALDYAKRQRGRLGTHDERFYRFQVGGKRGPYGSEEVDEEDLESEKRSDPYFHAGEFGKRGDPFFHQPGFGKRSGNNPTAQWFLSNGELKNKRSFDPNFHGPDFGKRSPDGFFMSPEMGKRGDSHSSPIEDSGSFGVGETDMKHGDDLESIDDVNDQTADAPEHVVSNKIIEQLQNSLQKRNQINPQTSRLIASYIHKPWRTAPFVYDVHDYRKKAGGQRLHSLLVRSDNRSVPYLKDSFGTRIKK